jgi:hypothetical protein
MNPDLVAAIFKEVFSKFRVYKKAPERFDGAARHRCPRLWLGVTHGGVQRWWAA